MAGEYGDLLPVGGGDPIELFKRELMVGRRESCDIVLRFANVSAHHCQLSIVDGYWYVKDLGSSNGLKVNGVRYQEKRLDPGDTLSVAKHVFEIKYNPAELGAIGPPPPEQDPDAARSIFKQSLLERAGLARPGVKFADEGKKRFDVMNNKAGQIKDHNKPV
ncbi:MAG TPA: FHA domain-containing protein [Pirellulales bacterium]|jgi:adenylate cyclase